ncbi:hypothetical protein E4U32_002755 [Claviceps aff. humidiphila group G2b]|nr:hypothetical protein E4U32_002755 [Claviceps aff. humidiphila group G2b]
MPLINGQKMACEPCIRGHRSTKCTHANERLMVPVRKPGRPLSSCPHPSSRPCACAAVTAAIPRKQRCRCGTSTPETAAVVNQSEQVSSPATGDTPPSPSKLANAGFRVHKQSAKTGPGRNQSIDISGLQRMDSSQINILLPHSTISPPLSSTNGSSTPMSDYSMFGSIAVTPSEKSHSAESSTFSMFPYAPGPIMAPTCQGQTKATMNGQTGVSMSSVTTSNSGTSGSCCGGGSSKGVNGATSRERAAPVHVEAPDFGSSNTKSDIEPPVRSCCSGMSASTSASVSPEGERKHTLGAMPPSIGVIPPALSMSFAAHNGIMMSPFQQPMVMTNGMYPFYVQPNIFHYPPQYGSYMQPLQPEQYRVFMASMSFGSNGQGQPFGMPPGPYVPQQQQQQQNTTPTAQNGSPAWTSHHCSCGDTCQCVGCAAHPYNEATQDYVRSAWNSMKEESPRRYDAQRSSNCHHQNGSADGSNASDRDAEDTAASAISSNGTTTPNKPAHQDGAWSPVAEHSPSDAASGASEEQALSASDFFFVSYPFADSCSGETMSCLCGDDCQCIGCTIHNNPGPVSSTEDEANSRE